MKKKLMFIFISLMLAMMTGCVEKIELTEEQEAKFIGYAVYSVLEHDNNYMVGLNHVDLEAEKPSETPTEPVEDPTNSNGENGNSSTGGENGNTATKYVTMESALGTDGLSIDYTGLQVCSSYPETDGEPVFVIKAYEGKKLVVLKFNVTNKSGADYAIDFVTKDLSFRGVFNKSVKTNAHVTLLPEALNTFKGTIPAGMTVEMILVFEMNETYAANITDITLDVKSDSEVNTVKIK